MKVIKTIAKGNIGTIELVRDDNKNYFIKKYNNNGRSIKLEYEILEIIQSFDSSNFYVKAIPDSFQKNFFLMEYLHDYETLYSILSKKLPIQSEIANFWINNIEKAIKLLHRNNITHRDIKLKNIMAKMDGSIKLIDFGSACQGNCNIPLISTRSYLDSHIRLGHQYNFETSKTIDLHAFDIVVEKIKSVYFIKPTTTRASSTLSATTSAATTPTVLVVATNKKLRIPMDQSATIYDLKVEIQNALQDKNPFRLKRNDGMFLQDCFTIQQTQLLNGHSVNLYPL
jgi:serine/threonine protein kinase